MQSTVHNNQRNISLLTADSLGYFLLARRIFAAFSYLGRTTSRWCCVLLYVVVAAEIVDRDSTAKWSIEVDLHVNLVDHLAIETVELITTVALGLPTRRNMSLGSHMIICAFSRLIRSPRPPVIHGTVSCISRKFCSKTKVAVQELTPGARH